MPTPNNIPNFTNGLTTPSDWINQIIGLLSHTSPAPLVELVFTTPSPIIPGKVYLLGSPLTGVIPGTAGQAIVYLTTSSTSAIVLEFPDNTVLGGYTRVGANWVRNIFTHNSVVFVTSSGTLTLPTTFDGVCTIVVSVTGVIVNGAAGRTGLGQIGVSLPIGVYTVFQSSTFAVI